MNKKRSLVVVAAFAAILFSAVLCVADWSGGDVPSLWVHTHRATDGTGPVRSDLNLTILEGGSTSTVKVALLTNGDIYASGTIHGVGSGSSIVISNVFATDVFVLQSVWASGSLYASGSVIVNGDIDGDDFWATGGLNVKGSAAVAGNISAATGTITGATGTFNGFTSLATSGSVVAAGNITAATGTVTAATGSFSTMTATVLYGDGSHLTGLTKATPTLQAVTTAGATTTTYIQATGFAGDGSQVTGVATATNAGNAVLFNNHAVSYFVPAAGGSMTGPLNIGGIGSYLKIFDPTMTVSATLQKFTTTDTLTLTNEILASGAIGAGTLINAADTNQYASATANVGAGHGAWSTSFWFKMPTVLAYPSISFVDDSAAGLNGVMVGSPVSFIYIFFANDSDVGKMRYCDFTALPALQTDHYYFIAAVHADDDTVSAYLGASGTLTTLSCDNSHSSAGVDVTPGPGFINVNNKNGSYGNNVAYNNIRIYKSVLSQTNAEDLYAGGVGTLDPSIGSSIFGMWEYADTSHMNDSVGSNHLASNAGTWVSYAWSGVIAAHTLLESDDTYDYLGDPNGATVLRGSTVSVATGTLRVGAFQAMPFAGAATGTYMMASSVVIGAGDASATVTFTYPFPSNIISANCASGIPGEYAAVESFTPNLIKCTLAAPSLAGNTVYWQAIGY